MRNQKTNFTGISTTGFGSESAQSGERFYRKDGSVNVIRKATGLFEGLSWYHSMVAMPRWKFWFWLCIFYVIVNLFFGLIYYFIGIESLLGVESSSEVEDFAEAFFFSAQTFTTVGYGRISPTGLGANAIAAIEAFLGVLSFAVASGLFYGRFARPSAFLRFSKYALISPYNEGTALMFRTAPYKNNNLMDAEVHLTMAIRVNENGNQKNIFMDLPVEVRRINSLALNWTIVHPLDDESPLNGMTIDDLIKLNMELLVYIKAFDEDFANMVVARTSYRAKEIIEGAKFLPMYYPSKNGQATVLDLKKLNAIQLVELPKFRQDGSG